MKLSCSMFVDFINGLISKYMPLKLCGIVILSLSILTISSVCWSQENFKEAVPVAENPEIEKRMLALTEDLRCLVCQNETIAESRADFSNDMRRVIREQIQANKTDAEIIEFLVDRYGDFVLYNPPMKPTTVLLWFGPLIFFIISAWFLVKYLKGRRLQIQEVTLSEADRKKIAVLLAEKDAALSEIQVEKTDTSPNKNNSIIGVNQSKSEAPSSENKGNNV
ncbi:Cytochrome c-type biogenesis protein CcmH/NrfF [Nitrosomonas aestuarii]|uniref:Cytochrome c-type biogenesis protein n=1 Tax=Nitrosomonas aestuarii TaxID=52441 RepID=A0A1I4ABC4_9PROT|nr:Cytochrome c-type biogenesis protein CcmH/NrfF [Nitrosomonas aestuarii]